MSSAKWRSFCPWRGGGGGMESTLDLADDNIDQFRDSMRTNAYLGLAQERRTRAMVYQQVISRRNTQYHNGTRMQHPFTKMD